MNEDRVYYPPGGETCPTCGEPLEMVIKMPLFDGKGGTFERTIRRQCECERKKAEEERRYMEYAEQKQKIDRLRRLSLMDEKVKSVTFNRLQECKENRKALHIGRRFVEKFDAMEDAGKGLLLWGNVGTGKSYLAAAIANALMDRMYTVIMTSFPKMLAERYDFNGEQKNDRISGMLDRVDLLIIDDLGAERDTDFALEQVYGIVDDRYRSGRPLIITTNLTFDHMKNCKDVRYNRIYDRIFEMCYPVKMDGISWRKLKAVSSFDEMKGLLEDGLDS